MGIDADEEAWDEPESPAKPKGAGEGAPGNGAKNPEKANKK